MCQQCRQPLGTDNFYERDGAAYCEPDYHGLFAPRCAHCSQPIVDVSGGGMPARTAVVVSDDCFVNAILVCIVLAYSGIVGSVTMFTVPSTHDT